MKKLLTTICLFFVFSFQSQINVTNNTKTPLWICIAYYKSTSNFKGYVSIGWWKIIPGETKSIGGYSVHNGDNTFYYYAYNESSKWKGDYSIAIHPTDKFEIINADKDYVLENDSKLKKVGFRQKTFHIGLLDPLSYSFDLTE